MTKHKATVSIEVGKQEVLVDVEYNYTPSWPASHDDPGAPWQIEILSGIVKAAHCGRKYDVMDRPAPDWLIQAMTEDIIDGGPIGDALVDDALARDAA